MFWRMFAFSIFMMSWRMQRWLFTLDFILLSWRMERLFLTFYFFVMRWLLNWWFLTLLFLEVDTLLSLLFCYMRFPAFCIFTWRSHITPSVTLFTFHLIVKDYVAIFALNIFIFVCRRLSTFDLLVYPTRFSALSLIFRLFDWLSYRLWFFWHIFCVFHGFFLRFDRLIFYRALWNFTLRVYLGLMETINSINLDFRITVAWIFHRRNFWTFSFRSFISSFRRSNWSFFLRWFLSWLRVLRRSWLSNNFIFRWRCHWLFRFFYSWSFMRSLMTFYTFFSIYSCYYCRVIQLAFIFLHLDIIFDRLLDSTFVITFIFATSANRFSPRLSWVLHLSCRSRIVLMTWFSLRSFRRFLWRFLSGFWWFFWCFLSTNRSHFFFHITSLSFHFPNFLSIPIFFFFKLIFDFFFFIDLLIFVKLGIAKAFIRMLISLIILKTKEGMVELIIIRLKFG